MQEGDDLVKKPTGCMTNAVKLAENLKKDCSGDHRHVVLIGGGRAKRAEVYPGELCKQIIFGLRDQMIHDGRLGNNMIGAVDRVDEFPIDHELYQMQSSTMRSRERNCQRRQQLEQGRKR